MKERLSVLAYTFQNIKLVSEFPCFREIVREFMFFAEQGPAGRADQDATSDLRQKKSAC